MKNDYSDVEAHRLAMEASPVVIKKAKKGASFEASAEHYSHMALDTLAEISHDRDAPASARVAACNAILDRARGKPIQEVKHSEGSTMLLDMLEDMKRIRLEQYEALEVEVIN